MVAAVDGLPEQVPGRTPTGLTLDQYAGNHIVQDLGNGNYALYAHIKTGAVKVKPGDPLTTGQVIGSVGNSGNSDAPHLHFHVMSTPDPLRSDGLPFVFTSFDSTRGSSVRTRWTRCSTASPPRYSRVSLLAMKKRSAHWFSM